MERATQRPGLTDSDVLIDASRGVAEAGRFLDAQQAGEGVTISAISAMELLSGCRNSAQMAEVQRFLDTVNIVQVTPEISLIATKLIERYTLSHGMLLADALIAATAIEKALPIYTKNLKHFRVIPELKVIRPY